MGLQGSDASCNYHSRPPAEGRVARSADARVWAGSRVVVAVGREQGHSSCRKKVSGRIRAEVAAKLRRLQRDLEDGVSSTGRQVTVALLCEDWLRQRSGELSGNTLDIGEWGALRRAQRKPHRLRPAAYSGSGPARAINSAPATNSRSGHQGGTSAGPTQSDVPR